MGKADLIIASVQFENASDDKAKNLGSIRRLAEQAKFRGSHVAAFHECSISRYTFASKLSKAELLAIAESIEPPGPSIESLCDIAKEVGIIILAGLFEKETCTTDDGQQDAKIYNTYLCVDAAGSILARFRKLYPFISRYLSPGNGYVVFNITEHWKAGILICYDNNIVENVRATALLGAEITFMPHVTMCTPSTRPGAGFVDPKLWENRENDPTMLRAEFKGLKGRKWLMKWLPARAYDDGIYVVFSNPIGMDADQLKTGCLMVLDPFGDILAECTSLGEDVAVARCHREELDKAGGFRYRNARRPELYAAIIGREHVGVQKVSWRTDP
jgi:predicted amidohydrolase